MNKKSFVLLGVFLALFLNARFLSAEQELKNKKEWYAGKIQIGYAIFPGYFPLIVAQEKGFFKAQGLDLELKQYIGLSELSRDYQAGLLQGRGNLTLEAVKEYFGGFDQRIVAAIDYSNGADAILAAEGIKTIQDFRGKRVAYEPDTLEEFFLAWALSENEMTLSDIVSVAADPEQCAKLLKEGKVDAAVTYEPFISQHLKGFNVIYSSKDAPGLITDVLTFRTDFVEKYPKTIEAIVRAYFQAVAFVRQNPEEAHQIMAKIMKDTPENIALQLEGIKTLDKKDNKIAFTFAAGLRSLYGNLRQIVKFVLKSQEVKNTQKFSNTDKLIEGKFLKRILQEEM